jgi:hypothetical protein
MLAADLVQRQISALVVFGGTASALSPHDRQSDLDKPSIVGMADKPKRGLGG